MTTFEEKTDSGLILSRRKLLTRAATGLVGVAVMAAFHRAALAQALAITPDQMEGPFFPEILPLDRDNDLVRVTGAAAEAMGRVLRLNGTVVDTRGAPVDDALVEIWQCDASGKYNHSGDRQRQPFDDKFQGYGRTFTAGDGSYDFRTIKPVPYPGRTPHIHFKIAAEGFDPLTTQMYIAGEPLNLRDGLFLAESPADQALLSVELREAPELEPNALAGNFQIVLGPR